MLSFPLTSSRRSHLASLSKKLAARKVFVSEGGWDNRKDPIACDRLALRPISRKSLELAQQRGLSGDALRQSSLTSTEKARALIYSTVLRENTCGI